MHLYLDSFYQSQVFLIYQALFIYQALPISFAWFNKIREREGAGVGIFTLLPIILIFLSLQLIIHYYFLTIYFYFYFYLNYRCHIHLHLFHLMRNYNQKDFCCFFHYLNIYIFNLKIHLYEYLLPSPGVYPPRSHM